MVPGSSHFIPFIVEGPLPGSSHFIPFIVEGPLRGPSYCILFIIKCPQSEARDDGALCLSTACREASGLA
jgi:hypothetical protein